MADVVSDAVTKFSPNFGGFDWMSLLGWILFVIILVAGSFFVYTYYKNKKVFTKTITAFEIIGGYWEPTIRDVAKVIKIGRGGFEILFLKKMKTWKIAYGGRVGISAYYFFIMPDGYWYNGRLLAGIHKMNDNNGLIPIVTTNPLMRGQYTSLEKQIDTLHGEKGKFWDKYGTWILGGTFLLIIGVLAWLIFKEFSSAMGTLNSVTSKQNDILEKLANLAGNVQASTGGGLTPA